MLICPNCRKPLVKADGSYKCGNGHSFDVAKKGYVNLLISNSVRHGDDKSMSTARRDFLNSGNYKPLADAVCDALDSPAAVIDIGCGECYYLENIKRRFQDCAAVGIDISKSILETASPRVRAHDLITAVAGCKFLPLADNSADAAISVFAPFTDSEVARVLKADGVFVRVVPEKDHLIELKRAVYDFPRPNEALDLKVNGMYISETKNVRYTFTADTQCLKNLFTMTPYYYKTSQRDRMKLDGIESLTVTADFLIIIYRKKM